MTYPTNMAKPVYGEPSVLKILKRGCVVVDLKHD